jgi:hypothetical protein
MKKHPQKVIDNQWQEEMRAFFLKNGYEKTRTKYKGSYKHWQYLNKLVREYPEKCK